MDNVIRVNVVNFITVGLMAFIFIYLLNGLLERVMPALALSTAAGTSTPASSSVQVPSNAVSGGAAA